MTDIAILRAHIGEPTGDTCWRWKQKGILMKDTVQTTAPVRRAVLAAAAAGVLVLGGLVGAIYLDEAIDDSTTSFVAGGGLWSG